MGQHAQFHHIIGTLELSTAAETLEIGGGGQTIHVCA